jgi:pentatricopeptide repeat protein
MDQLVRVGGSWAQRDLFAHTLLAAYLRTGRLDDARALLRQRVTRQPSVPVVAA